MTPSVEPSATQGLFRIEGVFFRGVDPAHQASALAGSRGAGRYSPPDRPALYLSASPKGVEAAMTAHQAAEAPHRTVMAFMVRADRIFDLRDCAGCSAAGIDRGDAAAPWQEIAARGGEPPSWQVADRVRALGANGLIDPSRQSPGLWHLVLFRWNRPGGPEVVAG